MSPCYVYIVTNHFDTLYTGVTSDLARRVYEHKKKSVGGFTGRYNIGRLVYYEAVDDIRSAIDREKQIKGWTAQEARLIEAANPDWRDLSAGWYDSDDDLSLRPK